MSATALRGVIAAAATPVHPDFSPDHARLLPHLRYLLAHGCDAINLLGTTGEANSFGLQERIAIMRTVREGGLPLSRFMVGTGVCSLQETTQLTQAAAELGFAGALVLAPFFYPDIAPQALIDYVDLLVQRLQGTRIALYLYHIPQNTGVPWPVEVVAELARRHPERLRGIKDSSGDMAYASEVARRLPGFDVFPSSEAVLADATQQGYAGCISASANLTAADSQAAWSQQGTAAGQAAVARASAQRAALSRQALVASVKAALAVRYRDDAWRRVCPPLVARNEEQTSDLCGALETAGLPLRGAVSV